jgi:hypothetical protein
MVYYEQCIAGIVATEDRDITARWKLEAEECYESQTECDVGETCYHRNSFLIEVYMLQGDKGNMGTFW